MAMDFTGKTYYFPVGTKLTPKEEWARGSLRPGEEYVVTKESHLPDEENGHDLEIEVICKGTTLRAFAHHFRRVK